MKSTLEDFREKLFKKGAQCGGKETGGMNSIIEFMKEDKGLNNQIMANATKTIKTIQPSILFSDFTIAMSMIQAVVVNAMYYLEENGYLEIKKKEVEEVKTNGDKKEWLKAIRLMVWDLKNIMENDNGESYDEEYYINKLNNIIENIDNKIKGDRVMR